MRLHDSIVVSIPACHAGDRGSIPRRGAFFNSTLQIINKTLDEHRTPLLCNHFLLFSKYNWRRFENLFANQIRVFIATFIRTFLEGL